MLALKITGQTVGAAGIVSKRVGGTSIRSVLSLDKVHNRAGIASQTQLSAPAQGPRMFNVRAPGAEHPRALVVN